MPKGKLEIANRLKVSLDKAFTFIKDNRNIDGNWSDFLTLAGESIYWVSGYVGYSISCFGKTREEEWLKNIGQYLLKHQQQNGGWSYGPGVPADADSTSWCLLFLSRMDIQDYESINKALSFLREHQNPEDGGFRTYAKPKSVGRYMMIDEGISFEGWSTSHMCVTGVTTQALYNTNDSHSINLALDCIRKNQTEEGYWNPYWWNDYLYSTVNCMNALDSKIGGKDELILNKARNWISKTQLKDGGWNNNFSQNSIPFSTALGLRGLMIGIKQKASENIIKGVEWLLTNQLTDGSWNSNHKLRIPFPSVKEPWKQSQWKIGGKAINALIEDHKRLFTTATVFKALLEYENFLSGEKE